MVVIEPQKREDKARICIEILKTCLDEGEPFNAGAQLGFNIEHDVIVQDWQMQQGEDLEEGVQDSWGVCCHLTLSIEELIDLSEGY